MATAEAAAQTPPSDDDVDEDSSRAAEIEEAWKKFVEKYNKKFETNSEERLR